MPDLPTRPTVGLMPTIPLADDGQTTEPLVSVPMAMAQKLAAAAAPEPELEPHGLRSRAARQPQNFLERVLIFGTVEIALLLGLDQNLLAEIGHFPVLVVFVKFDQLFQRSYRAALQGSKVFIQVIASVFCRSNLRRCVRWRLLRGGTARNDMNK